jgi:SAM-dependent methyltransferase
MTVWGQGDYPSMAETLIDVSRTAVAWCEVRPGDNVLDIATGTGNAALLAAAEGGTVVGIDAEPALLNVARRRSARAGLDVEWRIADVARTGVPDHWADVVVSVFGLMWGADAIATMREVARCVRPTGRVVLSAWIPGGMLPTFGAAMAAFMPPPPAGMTPPSQWGDEMWVSAQCESVGLSIEGHQRPSVTWSFRDADAATDFFVATAGSIAAERSVLERDGRYDDLVTSVRDVVCAHGHGVDDAFEIVGEYLLTRAVAT